MDGREPEPERVRFCRLMDGHRAKWPVPGYCKAPYHEGGLTARLMSKKRCIQKGCKYFRRNEESGYWVIYDRRKAESRARRQARKERLKTWTE